ncbi:MAG: hypothetical protein KGL11_04505 [Alphaproteobacteria bacterium]|nr:hypothetical protein [Alphaproteobacteria bacterium]
MRWRMTGEVELDELLGDALMEPVMRSAGVNTDDVRRQLVELARRLGHRPAPPAAMVTLRGERLTP